MINDNPLELIECRVIIPDNSDNEYDSTNSVIDQELRFQWYSNTIYKVNLTIIGTYNLTERESNSRLIECQFLRNYCETSGQKPSLTSLQIDFENFSKYFADAFNKEIKKRNVKIKMQVFDRKYIFEKAKEAFEKFDNIF